MSATKLKIFNDRRAVRHKQPENVYIRACKKEAENKSMRKSKYGESKSKIYRPAHDYGEWLDYS